MVLPPKRRVYDLMRPALLMRISESEALTDEIIHQVGQSGNGRLLRE